MSMAEYTAWNAKVNSAKAGVMKAIQNLTRGADMDSAYEAYVEAIDGREDIYSLAVENRWLAHKAWTEEHGRKVDAKVEACYKQVKGATASLMTARSDVDVAKGRGADAYTSAMEHCIHRSEVRDKYLHAFDMQLRGKK